jgi:hypothetical protein
MPLLSARTLTACCIGLFSLAAHAGPGMAVYLRSYYSINKDKVMKQAVANKDQAFKMMKETTKVDARQFCRASLNDLISKVREIDADATPVKKSGS